MKNKLDFLQENPLRDTVITDISVDEWIYEGKKNSYSACLKGDLPTGEYRHYDLRFSRIQAKDSGDDAEFKLDMQRLKILNRPKLKAVAAVQASNGYYVTLALIEGKQDFCISFFCEDLFLARWHYRGFDYTNVYGTQEYMDMIEKRNYAFDEKYFEDEEVTELPDGYSLCQQTYIHSSKHAMYGGVKCELRKDGKCIYAYTSTDDHHPPYKNFIYHSNGHRYYPFHIGLYGISYLDVDTLDVYHYVPRGYDNDHGAPNGESFIVTGVHYDPKTNLVAYDGCYWACPNDVMVGALDDPLRFDPRLISIDMIFDPEYDGYYNVNFVSWEEDGLSIQLAGSGVKIEKVSMDALKMAMEKQRKRERVFEM